MNRSSWYYYNPNYQFFPFLVGVVLGVFKGNFAHPKVIRIFYVLFPRRLVLPFILGSTDHTVSSVLQYHLYHNSVSIYHLSVVYLSAIVPISHSHHYYGFITELNMWKRNFSIFFSRLPCLGFAVWNLNFRISLLISKHTPAYILIGTVLNLQIDLGRISHLTILSPVLYEHGLSLHLFRSSVIYLNNI